MLADYLLVVPISQTITTAPSLLHIEEREYLNRVLHTTHQELLIGAADAICKEMLPWERGWTTREGNEFQGEAIQAQLSHHNRCLEYTDQVPNTVYISEDMRDHFGSTAIHLAYAMRQTLLQRDPNTEWMAIQDTLQLGKTVFETIERKNPKLTGWPSITRHALALKNLLNEKRDEDPDVLVAANCLIGQAHNGGGSIMMRISSDWDTYTGLLEVLDDSRDSSRGVFDSASLPAQQLWRRVLDSETF